jgi:hypothetical protein
MAADRRGIALIIVIVSMAVMLVLATVILANTASTMQRDHIQAGVTQLIRFGFEIGDNEKRPSFRGDIGAHPGRLSDLYVPITTARRNSCGTFYSGAEVGRWIGPYHLVPMQRDANYQLFPGLLVSDTLERVPATGNGPATLQIVMRNVALQTAEDLGRAFDGIASGAGPRITFTPNGTSPIDVRYNVPIDRC